MRKTARRVLSLLMILSMVFSLLPAEVFAWEETVDCEFCGREIHDDWICGCGAHCGEDADGYCYEEHHCAECYEAFESLCENCAICEDCAAEAGLHCPGCRSCSEDYYFCENCGYCEDCVEEMCSVCGWCQECAMDEGLHCPGCRSCSEYYYLCEECGYCGDCQGEICENCGVCEECAAESGLHCPGCRSCSEDYYLCENCGYCEDCADEICGSCNLCQECAMSEGFHCLGCGNCVEDYYFCYNCGYCEDCVGEICTSCDGLCAECATEEGYHCESCGNCGNDFYICQDCWLCEECTNLCSECELCVDCAMESGYHCQFCGSCVEDTYFCEYCGMCEECAKLCYDCGYCIDCAVDVGLHCSICLECSEYGCYGCGTCLECAEYICGCGYCSDCVSFCLICELCDDCAVESFLHCISCYGCLSERNFCQACMTCSDCEPICESHKLCEDCGSEESGHCLECGVCGDTTKLCKCGLCEDCSNGYCGTCEICIRCCIEEKTHCFECSDCLFEIGECFGSVEASGYPLCVECCNNAGYHCFVCEGHVEGVKDWCGDYTTKDHCKECGEQDMDHCNACNQDWCQFCSDNYNSDTGDVGFCGVCGRCSECIISDNTHCSECDKCFAGGEEVCPDSPTAMEGGEGYLCITCCISHGHHCQECEGHVTGVKEWHTYNGGNPTAHCVDCSDSHLTAPCETCGGQMCDLCDDGMESAYGYDDWFCETCGNCVNCIVSGKLHCQECSACYEDSPLCEASNASGDGHLCVDCCSSDGNHCELCEKHVESWCSMCGKGEKHCEECFELYALDCVCGEKICQWDPNVEYCEECGNHYDCAIAEGVHCYECYTCYEVTPKCAEDADHCQDCCTICEVCGECAEGKGIWLCEYCGLCLDCCESISMGAGCSTGEVCYESGEFEEHICMECSSVCSCENDFCEYCGLCIDCCMGISQTAGCSTGEVCVENSDFDDHICNECGSNCTCDVDFCDECELCIECCEDASSSADCSHGVCVMSFEWAEHYCEYCGHCFEDCDCTASSTCTECVKDSHEHTHSWGSGDICTVCGTQREGKPIITVQPNDASAIVSDPNGDYYNTVKFRITAKGENLTYKWYSENRNGTVKSLTEGDFDGLIKGTTTNTLTTIVSTDECSDVGFYHYYCVVSNENGSVTSDKVMINAEHSYRYMPVDSEFHQLHCVGEGPCEAVLGEKIPHAFGIWKKSGDKTYRECKCGQREYRTDASGSSVKYFDFVVNKFFAGESISAPSSADDKVEIVSYKWFNGEDTTPIENGTFIDGTTYRLEINAKTAGNAPINSTVEGKVNGMTATELNRSGTRISFKIYMTASEEVILKPVIIVQPKDVKGILNDVYSNGPYNTVDFNIQALGENLTYKWYYSYLNEPDFSRALDAKYFEGEGYDTPNMTIIVPDNSCCNPCTVYCVVSNEYGSVESERAVITADHIFKYFYEDENTHIYCCIGDGCEEDYTIEEHQTGDWTTDKFLNTTKTCSICKEVIFKPVDIYRTPVDKMPIEVEVPVAGAVPSSPKIASRDACIYNYNWYDNDGNEFTGNFVSGETYRLYIEVNTTANRRIAAKKDLQVTLNGDDIDFSKISIGSRTVYVKVSFTARSADGAPVITSQPKDVSPCVNGDLIGPSKEYYNPANTATFQVSAKGKDLTYKWYIVYDGEDRYELTEGENAWETNTNRVKVIVPSESCISAISMVCVVSNENGIATSRDAYFNTTHVYKWLYNDENTHIYNCIGHDCEATLKEPANHKFSTVIGSDGKGYEVCGTCGYRKQTKVNTAGLVSISVTKAPKKTTYVEGENFDPKGMIVTATYSDRTSYAVENYTIENGDNLAINRNNVSISFTQNGVTKKTTQEITMKYLKTLSITTPPDKVIYREGEDFDPKGMVVTATYSDESTEVVKEYVVEDGENLSPSKIYVRIKYIQGNSITFTSQNINVVKLVNFMVKTPPIKTVYWPGEDFDPKGMEMELVYLDDSRVVTTDFTIENGTNLKDTQTTVDIKHITGNGRTATRPLDISMITLKSIEVTTPPTKRKYEPGDSFEQAGMVVTVTYSDGTKKAVTGYTIADGDSITAGQKTVTVRYSEGSKNVNTSLYIGVKTLDSIKVTTKPNKLTYNEGEDFNPEGMVVSARYDAFTLEPVTDYIITNGENLTKENEKIIISYTEGDITKTAECYVSIIPEDKILIDSVTLYGVSKPELRYSPDISFSIDENANYTFSLEEGMEGRYWTAYTGENMTYSGVNLGETDKFLPNKNFKLEGLIFEAKEGYAFAHSSNIKVILDGIDESIYTSVVTNLGDDRYVEAHFLPLEDDSSKLKLESIKIESPAIQTQYDVGERFYSGGLKVYAYYSDGTNEMIIDYERPDGDFLSLGQTFITISYTLNGVTKKVLHPVEVIDSGIYDLYTFVEGGNGSISSYKTDIIKGTTETITFTPDPTYEIELVTVNGKAVLVTENTLTLTMDGNKEVVVRYRGHTCNPSWKADDSKHWLECSCGSKTEEGTHTGGTASCTVKARCTVCDMEYGTLLPHSYGLDFISDVTGHWNECECGAKSSFTAHTPDRELATETEPIKCSICDYIITAPIGHVTHTAGDTWITDGTEHWHKCTKCEEKLDISSHSGGVATCKEKAVCSVCGISYGKKSTTNHILNTFKYNIDNGENHKILYECCGILFDTEAHTFSNYDDTTCDLCGYVRTIIVRNVTVDGSYADTTGTGDYKFGESVTVYAGERSGYSFNGWTSSDITITDKDNLALTFIMPEYDVTIKANWSRNSSGGGSSGGSGSSGSSENNTPKPIDTTGSVTDKEISEAIKDIDEGEAVKITSKDTEAVKVSVEGVKEIIDNGNKLEVETESGSIELGSDILSSVIPEDIKEASIDIEVKEVKDITDNEEVKELLESGSPVFDVSIMLDGAKIHKLGGKARISFIYKDIDKFKKPIVKHFKDDGTVEIFKPIVDGKTVTIDGISSLSYFAIVEGEGLVIDTEDTFKFTDVKSSEWYFEYVKATFDKGLMKGVTETEFIPNGNTTRAMMVTILYNMEGRPKVEGNTIFSDVIPNEWYEAPISWAYSNGIAKGMGEGFFAPNGNITREQLAVILYNYALFKGEVKTTQNELRFTDTDMISSWALDAVTWCVENKIMSGKGNNLLDPNGFATRAEVATMVMNFTNM